MGVAVHTKLAVILIAFGIGTSFAENTESTSFYLRQEIARSLISYEKSMDACESETTSDNIISLPIDRLKKARVTPQELQAAIVYLREESFKNCVESSRLELMSAILDLHAFTASTAQAPIDPSQSGLGILIPSHAELEARAIFNNLEGQKAELLRSIFHGVRPSLAKISNWREASKILASTSER